MADSTEKILYELKIEENRALKSLTKVKEGVKTLDRRTTKYKETVKEQIRLESQLNSIRKQRIQVNKGVENSVKDLTKAQVQKKNAVGASTSATLELGRVLSDMPYGIRGVANNLQQLASNLFFMSKATDAATGNTVGFGGAISRLLKGLIGPAGILIAFQGIIALFDFFSQGAKKAEDSVRDYLSSVSDLLDVQTDLNDKIEEYLVLGKLKEDLDTSKTEKNKKLKKLDEELLQIEKDKQSALKLLTLNQEAYQESLDKTTTKAKGYLKGETTSADKIDKLVKRENEINKERIGITGVYLAELKKYREEKDNLTKAEEDSLKGLKNTITELKKERELRAKSPEDYKRLSVAIDEVQKKIDKIKGGGDVFAGKFVESYYREIAGLEEIIKDEDFDGISDSAKITGKLILPFEPTFVPPEESFYEELDRFIERYQTVMTGLTSFVDGEFERQLTIEQNKTNILNEELNNRLLNESLSADQRKSIQNEIAQNDERLRVRQEAIKKKAFNTEKAFNISTALIETYSAASSAFKNTLANPVNKLLPDAGLLRAKINAGVATAGGLLQVAAIARQKYQSSSAATPVNVGGGGASGGASERADPSFNIVGRSNDNLLINAIQAQFGKPLKAYVVSRDVTTQQQLDGMIVGQAGT